MQYRVEVIADYAGEASDVTAEAVSALSGVEGAEFVREATQRHAGTRLMSVYLTFTAPDDTTAHEVRRALRDGVRRGTSINVLNLRTGRGKNFRRLS